MTCKENMLCGIARSFLLSLTLVTVLARKARADSDGYFCIRIVSHTSDPGYKFRTFPRGPDNIGNLAQPGITELPSRGGYPRFQLRVTDASHRVESGVQHDMQSVLEEIDASGQVRRSLVIYKGGRYESVDDGNSG